MMLDNLEKLNRNRIKRFYEPDHSGAIVIHDPAIMKKVLQAFKTTKHQVFALKDYQNINNGQGYYSASNKTLMGIYKIIRSRFKKFPMKTSLECGFTEYPASDQGAEFHLDFSRNVTCTITFFSGYTIFYMADDKQGKNLKKFPIRPGDVLIMRAPRSVSKSERAMRPIHAIGIVPEKFHAFEVRETVVKIKKK